MRRGDRWRSASAASLYAVVSAFTAIVASAVFFLAPPALATAADSCPNAAFRIGPSASLPDCRAYEQVSPVDKNGYDIEPGNEAVAPSGDAITYDSFGAFAGSQGAGEVNQYVSFRGPSGWSTEGITPPRAPALSPSSAQGYAGFSGDLSHMALLNGDPPIDGATPGTANLYLRDPDGSFQLISIGEPSNQQQVENNPIFDGASSDYSHILFEDQDALTPNAPNDGRLKVYEWVNGGLSLVSILPDRTPSDGTAGGGSRVNGISADGSRVYWWVSSPGSIFLRENGSSTEITASQCTAKPSCATGSQGGSYWDASVDGLKALFTSQSQLTNDSTATGQGPNSPLGELYEYDAGTGALTDLAVDPSDPNGGQVLGVVGASSDLSYVYFVADGALATGATAGQPNLYVRHDGTTRLIATLSPSDNSDWSKSTPVQGSWRAQVSADGLHLLFTSVSPLAPGYDNAGHSEVYRYDAGGPGPLTCVSCNPGGAPAGGDADLAGATQPPFAATLALVNNMSADGTRVFFESSDALLPQDSNGLENVYEWEADGTGSCQTAGGCLYSISSGRSSSPSYFEDASSSGDDVFFVTREQLVAQDTDNNVDLYDARVGGGFPPPTQAGACSPEDCHGQPSSPLTAPVAASVTFFGPGNASAPPGSHLAKVRVLTSVVRGGAFTLRVSVPVRGRATITGAGIRPVSRMLGRAGVYRVRVALTARDERMLKRRRQLKLALRVRFAPASGAASSAGVYLTVRR